MWKKGFMVCAVVLGFSGLSWGQGFYEGKVLHFVVGFSAGGGFDIHTRAIARHIGKHIPGNPATIVENKPGAGSLLAANSFYAQAQPDGLTLLNFHGGMVLHQVLGRKGINFDARRFEYVGVPVSDTQVCILTKASGITSLEEWYAAKRPVKLGSTGIGTGTYDVPTVAKAALDLPLQIVLGYRGTSQVKLAVDSGETDGACWSWQSIKPMWASELKSGHVKVVLQVMSDSHPDLKGVPVAGDLVKGEDLRRLIKVGVHDPAGIVRPYVLPPGTPKDRVAMLRKAFMATMNDPDFLAEAKRSKLDTAPKSGQEVQKIVEGLFNMDSKLKARLREMILPKK